MNDELLDLVDRNDNVIGQRLRSDVYKERLVNFRVVNAFLLNKDGQLWVPRRTAEKRLFPLSLDASMGGHVMSGESYDDAFMRELAEELRLDASVTPHKCIARLNPYEHNTSAFMQLYVLFIDTVPFYNTQDFTDYYWLTPQEALDRIAAGDAHKGDLPHIIKYVYQYLLHVKE